MIWKDSFTPVLIAALAIVYNSQDIETTYMPQNRWVNQDDVGYIDNELNNLTQQSKKIN